MNDTMSGSTASTDDEVVARLRRALDEVAAGADALDADLAAAPARPPHRVGGWGSPPPPCCWPAEQDGP